MQNAKRLMQWSLVPVISAAAVILFTGCHSCKTSHVKTPAPTTAAAPTPATPAAPVAAAAPAPAAEPAAPAVPAAPVAAAATTEPAAPATPAVTATPAPVPPPVRIKAGRTTPFTDSEGNVWLPDQGFADGDSTDRPDDMQITNTKDPAIYRTEHYAMTSFSYPVPNGKYIVKLHFAETFEGITGPGGRVFSFSLGGQTFNDFDIWVKAGGAQHAYVETVNVEVTNGKLDISFTSKEENPEINGIEILPAPAP